MTRVFAVAALTLTFTLAAATPSSAHHCGVGNSGVTYGPGGPAKFKRLHAMKGMNCPSARYVLNKWIRRQYRNTGQVRRRFYDGYVTWYCVKRSRRKFRCDEYESNTAFSFVAYRL